ncbi:protein translocase subunit SecF [Nakamurella sp. A5-74]|uniref:Protein-export membrane protein SecF n=1 Tax=Nakamurella sp. A5-74 TaxID=3158264 RepID=A0AAU8DKK5_9ACTN
MSSPMSGSGSTSSTDFATGSEASTSSTANRASRATAKGHSVGTENESFISRLSTGTGAFDVLKRSRAYYGVGIALVIISALLIGIKGFNLGIDFAGGTKLTFSTAQAGSIPESDIARVVEDAVPGSAPAVQSVGSTGIQVTTGVLSPEQSKAAGDALTKAFNLTTPDGAPSAVASSAVSGTWGAEVSQQAIISVIVFLIAVALFIWIRYEKRAAVAGVVSTIQVMIITAGIYALVGFEMSPATVIGLLTILGFSLYDTVVVFDKVQENTAGLTSLTRRTYAEAANLAVNQTLMRSINTSLIALLPVAGLLYAGVVLQVSGTLRDLALVQLVGMIVGAYSSLFVAVPLAVDLRVRTPSLRAHTKRVLSKRASEGLLVDPVGDPVGYTTPTLSKSMKAPVKSAGALKPRSTATTATLVEDAPTPSLTKPRAATSRPAPGRRPAGKAAKPSGKRSR